MSDIINGFGMATGQEVADLNKALSAGYATSPETQQNGGAGDSTQQDAGDAGAKQGDDVQDVDFEEVK